MEDIIFLALLYSEETEKKWEKHTHLKHQKVDLQTPESKEPQIQWELLFQ